MQIPNYNWEEYILHDTESASCRFKGRLIHVECYNIHAPWEGTKEEPYIFKTLCSQFVLHKKNMQILSILEK